MGDSERKPYKRVKEKEIKKGEKKERGTKIEKGERRKRKEGG